MAKASELELHRCVRKLPALPEDFGGHMGIHLPQALVGVDGMANLPDIALSELEAIRERDLVCIAFHGETG